VLAFVWIALFIFGSSFKQLGEELSNARSALPILLLALAALGMLWANVGITDRFGGIASFAKLLAIPLLILQFKQSPRGNWVMLAFLAGCVVALLGSAIFIAEPALYWRTGQTFPVPFKNQATQSGEFIICICVLLFCVIDWWRAKLFAWSFAALFLCAAFLVMTVYSATGRTALVTAPLLIVLLAFRRFNVRGALAFILAGAVIVGAMFYGSPYLQERTGAIWGDIQRYQQHRFDDVGLRSSTGERLDFWKKSLLIISRAPLIGHGTGTILAQMAEEMSDLRGSYPLVTTNPHQQTFAVAIQLGLLGALLLWAMWGAHWLVFRADTLAAWIGAVIVVNNVIGSLFNSHLFDFTQGWIYVLGVGVAAGMVERAKGSRPA
jgi:O-antigen ligase